MAKAPSKTPLIVAAVMVVGVIAGFNVISEKYRPKTEHELEAAAQKEQAEAAKNAQKNAPSPPPETGAAPATASLVMLGDEATLGAAQASSTITVGWSWTPDVQADPGKIWNGIQAVQKVAPSAKIHVVNTDAGADVPEGVSLDGAVIVPLAPDGSLPSGAEGYQNLQGALMGKAAAPPAPK